MTPERPPAGRDAGRPLRVVSVSLGAPARDAVRETTLLGRRVRLERIGTNGDVRAAAATFARLAGTVDAFGLGGTDLELRVAGRRYRIRESVRLARHAGPTPVVCGAGLKDTLERWVPARLEGRIALDGARVLLPSAVDRWGLAEALRDAGARLTIGDLAFLLGVPHRMHDLDAFARVVRVLAPPVVRLPIGWIYPTGAKQGTTDAGWRRRWFDDADVVAGDWHLVRRFAPTDLHGRTILTNTTTAADLDDLGARGVRAVVTTTPRLDGRSLPTNLLEAAFTAIAGRHPLPRADLAAMVAEADLAPDVWTPPPRRASGGVGA